MDNKTPWYRQKTTWTGIAAIVAGAGGISTGEMDMSVGLNMIAAGLIAIFLRQGIEKAKQ